MYFQYETNGELLEMRQYYPMIAVADFHQFTMKVVRLAFDKFTNTMLYDPLVSISDQPDDTAGNPNYDDTDNYDATTGMGKLNYLHVTN